jgi:hypothetical protein
VADDNAGAMINRFELAEIGMDYFTERMRSGLALARAVSAQEIVRLYALLPSDTLADAVNDFEHGGKLQAPPRFGNMQRVPNTDAELADVVIGALTASQQALVILEDEISRPSDPYLKNIDGLLFENGDVYHVLDGIQAQSKEAFLSHLTSARSTPNFRGFVVNLETPFVPARDRQWAAGDLARLAKQTRLAFLSAYDGESFLVAEFA